MRPINKKIIHLYNAKLKEISVFYKEEIVFTNFGKTNVLILGDNKKPPLFLIHGLNSGAPFAIDTVSILLKKYQIFAIDILGQPNKSDFVRLNKKDASYGKWLLEIITNFKADSYTLCGISFGAFPILKSLLINETKVKEVFLISPASIVNGSLLKTISRYLLPMQKFKKTKNIVYLEKSLSSYHNEFDDLEIQFTKEVFLNFKMDFSLTPNFKTKQLATIKTPITIITSKNDYFVPAKRLKKKSEKSFLSLKNFVVLKDSKHIASKEILKNCFEKLD